MSDLRHPPPELGPAPQGLSPQQVWGWKRSFCGIWDQGFPAIGAFQYLGSELSWDQGFPRIGFRAVGAFLGFGIRAFLEFGLGLSWDLQSGLSWVWDQDFPRIRAHGFPGIRAFLGLGLSWD